MALRYGGPLLISETAGSGDGRSAWLDEISDTALQLLRADVQLVGVCIYPVLGMPEWHDRGRWARMGLWDLEPSPDGLLRRPSLAALAALQRAQTAMAMQANTLRHAGHAFRSARMR